MHNDIELKPAHRQFRAGISKWRNFCAQWRHCYLLLVAMFGMLWALAPLALPKLDNVRLLDGRHPLDVLSLMDDLRGMWGFVVIAAAIYALSFAIRPLNTPAAVAVISLVSCGLMAMMFTSSLLVFALW
jgi:hypothetical protein